MLMFENILLATFIPEILMVLGFLLCLCAPGFKSADSTVDQAPIMAQVITIEHTQHSTYAVSICDFQTVTEVVLIESHPARVFEKEIEKKTLERPFDTSKGLIYIGFSRPPPFIFA